MSKASKVSTLLTSEEDFPRDVTLEVLSNERRRYVLHYLKQNGDGTTVSELAERVASWEYGKEHDALTHKERKRVRNALRQFHLPKMDDYEFIEYDSRRGTVELTDAADDAEFYVDSITGSDVPWGLYYLAFSAVSVLVVVVLWLGIYPLTMLSPLTYGVFFATALLVSSAGHFYDNYYRMRLGAQEQPPEASSNGTGDTQ